MEHFIIKANGPRISSINRTVRFRPETFETLCALSETHGVSFNKLVNQCVEYALENLEE